MKKTQFKMKAGGDGFTINGATDIPRPSSPPPGAFPQEKKFILTTEQIDELVELVDQSSKQTPDWYYDFLKWCNYNEWYNHNLPKPHNDFDLEITIKPHKTN